MLSSVGLLDRNDNRAAKSLEVQRSNLASWSDTVSDTGSGSPGAWGDRCGYAGLELLHVARTRARGKQSGLAFLFDSIDSIANTP
jgi:hypothetical protein